MTGVGKHGFDSCLFWELPETHAPRDVPLTRARTVATNVLSENMLMIDRIRKDNKGSFRLRGADASIF